jgi:uncharacterized tellurite resistance protein B-like protein
MTEEKTITRFEGTQLIVETGDEKEVYDASFLVAALLVSIANSDGEISSIETEKMLQLVGDHFEMKSSESLELLTTTMEDLAEKPDLTDILKELATVLTSADKEDVAVMMYKVVAADGREATEEMDTLNTAAKVIGISPESLQKAHKKHASAFSPKNRAAGQTFRRVANVSASWTAGIIIQDSSEVPRFFSSKF